MAVSTRYANSSPSPHDEFDRYRGGELAAGERIGGLPRRRSRVRQMLTVMLLMAGVGAYAYVGDVSQLRSWLPADLASFLSTGDQRPAVPSEARSLADRAPEAQTAPKLVEAPPPTVAVQPSTEAVVAPDRTAAVAPITETEVATEPEPKAEAEAPERLPPPVVDLSDPYQRRATAVGLHPELSRALLEKLSDADYRNAGAAIKTALAETPDSEVLVWPRERKAGLALFQVRFVAGAPADCRRYVVAIVKDGWLTTALPMERCGIKPVRSAARVSPVQEKARSSAP